MSLYINNIHNTFWHKGFQTLKNTFPYNLYCVILFIFIPYILIELILNFYSIDIVRNFRNIFISHINYDVWNFRFLYYYIFYAVFLNIVLFIFCFIGYFALIRLSADFLSARPLSNIKDLFVISLKKIFNLTFLIIIILCGLIFFVAIIIPLAIFFMVPFFILPVLYIVDDLYGLDLVKQSFFFYYIPKEMKNVFFEVYLALLTVVAMFFLCIIGSYFLLQYNFDIQLFLFLKLNFIKFLSLNLLGIIIYILFVLIKILLKIVGITFLSIFSTSLYFWLKALIISNKFKNEFQSDISI